MPTLRALRALAPLAALALLLPGAAHAFPWMVKHHYTGCAACHVDPAGGGLETPYGRVQALTLLERRAVTEDPGAAEGEAPRASRPLLGLVPAPDWLLLEVEVRAGGLVSGTRTSDATTFGGRPIVMATDVGMGVMAGRWRASATLGVAVKRAQRASLSPVGTEDQVKAVSREHWLGYTFADDAVLVRGGRMTLPFGLRSVEHTLFARTATRTDSNEHQQHGLGLHWEEDTARIDVMAILGNYQVKPDAYRERGGSVLVEWALGQQATLGLSSLVTYAREDLDWRETQTLRMAHGLSTRLGLSPKLVLLGEADLLLRRTAEYGRLTGAVGYVQADYEVRPGLHLLGTLEALRGDRPDPAPTQLGLWASVSWFALRATELRLDTYVRRATPTGESPGRNTFTAILQLHFYP